MAKFIYRMQSILNIKLKLEEQAKAEFAIASGILKQEEEKLEAIHDEIRSYQDRMRVEDGETLDLQELLLCTDAIEIKKEQAKEQKRQVQIAESNLDRARVKLSDVMVERKTHEILKDRAFEEFKQDVSYQEKQEIDELVSYKNSNKQ